ncbi:MAG: hypothetical protein WDW36_003198 [Sanguina aurantia]
MFERNTPSRDRALAVTSTIWQRCRTTIEDFCQSYFKYHGLGLQDVFKFLDVLLWVEGTLYQLDEDNEAAASRGELGEGLDLVGGAVGSVAPASSSHSHSDRAVLVVPHMVWLVLACVYRGPFANVSSVMPTGSCGLLPVLRQQGLLDDRIEAELLQGEGYWRRERQLCAQMLRHPDCRARPAPLLMGEVLAAHEAKSFDYRVLNLLLFRLTRRPYDEALLTFLRLDEMLVDIGDDLFDYEDDVIANSFNILRAFVHIHGEEAELHLIRRISELEQRHRTALAGLSVELQQHWASRHHEAAGGEEGGGGRWSFPPIIYDEGSFRQCASSP